MMLTTPTARPPQKVQPSCTDNFVPAHLPVKCVIFDNFKVSENRANFDMFMLFSFFSNINSIIKGLNNLFFIESKLNCSKSWLYSIHF